MKKSAVFLSLVLAVFLISIVSAFPLGTKPIPGHDGSQITPGSILGLRLADNLNLSGNASINDILNVKGVNVGIGTSNPTQLLDIIGRQKIRTDAVGFSPGIWFANASGYENLFIGSTDTSSSANFGIYAGGAFRLQINQSTGNVGIGTTSPGVALDVRGSINTTNITVNGLSASQAIMTDSNKNLVSNSALTTLAGLAVTDGAMMYADGSAWTSQTARFKVLTFSRDMTAASGSVAYTGVGFKPKAVLFIGAPPNTPGMSISFYDGSATAGVYDLHVDVANSWAGTSSRAFYARTSAGTSQDATITSIDADGVTLSWTKTGAPSAGTLTLQMIFFR